MSDFVCEPMDVDIVSWYPLTEQQKEQLLRSWLVHQVQADAYKQGCYQNKINYIVWRLGL